MKRSTDVVVLVSVLGAFLLLNGLLLGRAAKVARRTEIVPVPSTYRTTASGTRACYELLTRLGLPCDRLLTRLTRLPDDADVVLLLEPQITITPVEALELRRWVDRGGTAIIATEGLRTDPSPVRALVDELFYRDPEFGQARLARISRKLAAAGIVEPYRDGEKLIWHTDRTNRYLAGVSTLELDLGASHVPSPAALSQAIAELSDERREWPIAGDPPAWLAVETALGKGRVLLLSTAAWFHNGQLAQADNARFVTNLVRGNTHGGRVLFDEYHLGHVGEQSLTALLWRLPVRYVTLQVLLALLLLAWHAAVRFGPARDPGFGPLRRPAVEGVRALAGLYRRSGATDEAARLWRQDALRRLAQAVGLPARASPERLAARVSERAGEPVEGVQSLLAELDRATQEALSEGQLLALTQRVDRLLRQVGRR